MSGLGRLFRSSCSACGGPIEWCAVEDAFAAEALAELTSVFGSEGLEAWRCLACGEAGVFGGAEWGG